jgi:DNA-binding response OmpR family regulator
MSLSEAAMFLNICDAQPELLDRMRVAIVDDEQDLRTSIVDYLRMQGADALEACDAAGLDRLLAGNNIDLVVLDVNMPGEDGFSIARRLRASSNVGLIMLTSRNETVDRVLGLEFGADDYLTKPFELRELYARVRAVLRRKQQTARCAAAVASAADAETSRGGIWSLRLLGPFQLIGPDGTMPLHARKAIALLTYLAFQPGQSSRRDILAALLWEDVETAQARASLRQALAAIRRHQGAHAPILIVDPDSVRLSPDVAVDALAPECAGGIRSHHDELLAGLDFPHMASFNAWLSIERARIRQTMMSVLGRRIEAGLEAGGDLNLAAEAAFRLLTLDSLSEVGHRGLMAVHARQGRAALALRQFRHLSELLAEELQVSPEAETRQLYDRIKAGRYRITTPFADPGPSTR